MSYQGICGCNLCGIIIGIGCFGKKRKLKPQKNRICNLRLIFIDIFIWSDYS
jgi:hypothetical protein